MASGNFVLDKGYDGAAAVTKFRAVVKTSVADTVAQASVSGSKILGVSQFQLTDAEIINGKGVSCRLLGITEWEAAAALAEGQEVSSDNQGRCKVPVTGDRVVGIVVNSAAAAAGDRCGVFLYGGGFIAP